MVTLKHAGWRHLQQGARADWLSCEGFQCSDSSAILAPRSAVRVMGPYSSFGFIDIALARSWSGGPGVWWGHAILGQPHTCAGTGRKLRLARPLALGLAIDCVWN